jgi:Mrp family chromosome partitioning ATPase
MSNNFELLSQLEISQEVFPKASEAAAQSPNSRKAVSNGNRPNTYSEALNLVQRVFLSRPEIAPQVVVFTSPQSGTGCSWVCARTAEVLAERFPEAVCVVDGNLRSPAMHRYFLVNNNRGLAQSLVGKEPILDYVQKVTTRKISVLTTGAPILEMTPSLSNGMIQRLTELRQRFTYLLIDSPATNLYADVALLSPVSDGAILVLEADSTRGDAALQAKDVLLAAKFRLLGAALNKRTFHIPEFIYHRL